MDNIYELEINRIYLSRTGQRFKLLKKGVRYALDCSIFMVVFTNINPTKDQPAGTEWILDEDTFIKTFTEEK